MTFELTRSLWRLRDSATCVPANRSETLRLARLGSWCELRSMVSNGGCRILRRTAALVVPRTWTQNYLSILARIERAVATPGRTSPNTFADGAERFGVRRQIRSWYPLITSYLFRLFLYDRIVRWWALAASASAIVN